MKLLFILLAASFAGSAFKRIYFHEKQSMKDAKWLAKHFGNSGPDGLDMHVARDHNRRFAIIYLVFAAVCALLATV